MVKPVWAGTFRGQISYFVIPPNSNTFSYWRRTCHVWKSTKSESTSSKEELIKITSHIYLVCQKFIPEDFTWSLVSRHWEYKCFPRIKVNKNNGRDWPRLRKISTNNKPKIQILHSFSRKRKRKFLWDWLNFLCTLLVVYYVEKT